jgi:hypothetical protein
MPSFDTSGSSERPLDLPHVTNEAEAEEGIGRVKTVTSARPPRGLGFQFHQLREFDRGVDGLIEVVGTEIDPSAAPGKIVGAQVKSGRSYFGNDDGDTWSLYIPKRVFHYWVSYSVPVVLILVDLDGGICYWTRADSPNHEQTEESFRVRVPKASRLDTTARDAIRSLAQDTPPSLAQLIDRSALTLEAEAIRIDAAAAETANDHERIGDRHLVFANRLISAGRSREAARQRQAAVKEFRRARNGSRAATELAALLEWTLAEFRDGHFSATLLLGATAADRMWPDGREDPPAGYLGATSTDLRRLELAIANAYDLDAEPAPAVRLANSLEQASRSGLNITSQATASAVISKLRAAVAVSNENHGDARMFFAAAAQETASLDTASECLVRSALHRGLDGDRSGGLAELATLTTTGLGLESLRLRATGWLNVLDGNPAAGAAAFRSAAEGYIALGDAPSALRAMKNALWANRQPYQRVEEFFRNAALARELETHAEQQVRRRELTTVEHLIDKTETHLQKTDLFQAYRAALRVLRLAHEDIDPAAIEAANVSLAEIWRRACMISPDPESLKAALQLTAVTRTLLKDDIAAAQLPEFYEQLREHTDSALLIELVRSLVHSVSTSANPSGVLRVLAEMSDAISDTAIISEIVPLLITSFSDAAGQSVEAAAELTCELADHLPSESALQLVGCVVQKLRRVPVQSGENLYAVLACAISRTDVPAEEADSLVAMLDASLAAPSTDKSHRGIYAVLGLLATRTTGRAVETIVDILTREASKPRWDALEELSALNAERATELAEKYLAQLTAVVRERLAEVGTRARSGTWPPFYRLLQNTAHVVSAETRDTCLAILLSFLEENEHLVSERALYLPVVAYLGRESPTHFSSTLDTLLTWARGQFRNPNAFAGLSSHPFGAGFSNNFPSPHIRHNSLTCIAYLYERASGSGRERIHTNLIALSNDSQPAVRLGVLKAIEQAIESNQTADSQAHRHDLLRALWRLADDPSNSVRIAALRVLARRSPTNDTVSQEPVHTEQQERA